MIRDEVSAHLASLIAGDGITGDVDVSPTFPGEKHTTSEMIFGDSTTGVVTFPYGMEPPRIQRDNAELTFVVRITAREDMATAKKRCQELANLVVGILAGADLLGFGTDGEKVTDTNPDGQGIQVQTREGESNKGVPVALAEITVPIETQTTNTEG